ncbi:MAG TPA: glycosyltransferase family 87 protein [Polyangiales bacterium]
MVSVSHSESVAVRFSPRGRKLFAFWLFAAACFVAGWWWRPHSVPDPTSQAPSQTAAQAAPAEPRAPGVLGAIHSRLSSWDDSWDAMRAAIDVLRTEPGRPLYAAVFERKFKFQYPPSSLLGLEALEALFGPAATSNLVLNLLGLLLMPVLYGSVYLLCRPALPPARAALLDHALPVLFALCCYPVLKAIQLGQIQTHLNAMLALAVLLYVRGRSGLAGVVIGLMATIKPQMGLFLVWSLVRRDFVFARAMAATAGAIELLALARYGLAHHLEYLKVLSEISRRGESYYANQSLNGLLLRALRLGPNLQFDFAAFAPYSPWVRYPTLIGSLLLIGLALWPFRANRESRGVDFVLAVLCFTIGSPVAWEHHYGVAPAIFAVAIAALTRAELPRHGFWLLGAAWILVSTRIGAVAVLADTPFNFLQSYTYFGGLLALWLLYQLRRESSALQPAEP